MAGHACYKDSLFLVVIIIIIYPKVMHCQLSVVSSTVHASANHGRTDLTYCRMPHTRFYSGHGT